jgi:hypothetical protein
MKTVANRLIVFAASALALGTVAFGQERMTAEVPFAFHTVDSVLPAGTYEFTPVRLASVSHLLSVRNTATNESTAVGLPVFDQYNKSTGANPTLTFVCQAGACQLKAIRTSNGTLNYPVTRPSRSAAKEAQVAVITIPAKVSSGD